MSLEELCVGKQIGQASLERNLSRDQLGTMLGISPQQVRDFEEDCQRMPAGLLYKLAGLLDLPVTDFFKR